MANLPISGLPLATTPLAGTEVLPIVQSGVTTQVSVANLTAGRSVSAGNIVVTSSTIPTNGLYLPAANTLGWATDGALRVRVSSIGIVSTGGLTSPDGVAGSLHVFTGSAGTATAPAASDELIIESAGAGGATFITPDANQSALVFSSPSLAAGALVAWQYSGNTFEAGSARVGASFILKAGANITNLTLSGAAGAENATFVRHIVSTNGDLTLSAGDLIITTPTTPATAGASGVVGTIAWDSGFLYACIATNTWQRVATATW